MSIFKEYGAFIPILFLCFLYSACFSVPFLPISGTQNDSQRVIFHLNKNLCNKIVLFQLTLKVLSKLVDDNIDIYAPTIQRMVERHIVLPMSIHPCLSASGVSNLR